jgi:type III secretion protein T
MIIPIDELKEWFFIYSMGMPRIVALFTLIPFLHKRMLGGAMMRNGICACLMLFLYPMLAEHAPLEPLSIYRIAVIVLKEVFIGALLGFCITIPFWALESAGFFIDNQRGASMASALNPLSGAETSPMGVLFSQAFTAIFMVSGLFLLLLQSLFFSYDIWPVFSYYPRLNPEAAMFFLNQFDLIIGLAMWLSAPVIISMFITEFGIALISRSAPQLNVFILAMPIKSGVAAAILVIYISTILTLAKEHDKGIPMIFQALGRLWQ